jgi:hypothetical protein
LLFIQDAAWRVCCCCPAGLLPVLAKSCSQLAGLLQQMHEAEPHIGSNSSSSKGAARTSAAAAKVDGLQSVSDAVTFLLYALTSAFRQGIMRKQQAALLHLWQPACSLVLAVLQDIPKRQQQQPTGSSSSSSGDVSADVFANCRRVPLETAVTLASLLPEIIQEDYLYEAQDPHPFGRRLTAEQQQLACGQQLLQVWLVNLAAVVQQVYKQADGKTAVLVMPDSSSSRRRQQQQQRWAVQPHHAVLLAAAVPGLPADMQLPAVQNVLNRSSSSSAVQEPHRIAALLHLLGTFLGVRASNCDGSSVQERNTAALPSSLAVPLYGCVAELALLMTGQPAVVAACCSMAAAVCGIIKEASSKAGSTAVDAAAAAGSESGSVLGQLDQMLLHERLPAAVHACIQLQQQQLAVPAAAAAAAAAAG